MKKYGYEFLVGGWRYEGTAYGGDSEEVEEDIKANNPEAVNIEVWRVA